MTCGNQLAIDDHAKDGDIYVVFTMILCALRSLETLIILLSKLMWVSNQKLVLSEAFWS